MGWNPVYQRLLEGQLELGRFAGTAAKLGPSHRIHRQWPTGSGPFPESQVLGRPASQSANQTTGVEVNRGSTHAFRAETWPCARRVSASPTRARTALNPGPCDRCSSSSASISGSPGASSVRAARRIGRREGRSERIARRREHGDGGAALMPELLSLHAELCPQRQAERQERVEGESRSHARHARRSHDGRSHGTLPDQAETSPDSKPSVNTPTE